MTEQRQRVAAYALCQDGDQLLLARYVSPHATQRHWTLPGGKVEHGEDPYDTVVREVAEETGYAASVEELLGVDSHTVLTDSEVPVCLHRLSLFYRVRITGGQLRDEVGGSTDRAAWIALSDVPALPRASNVDSGLALLTHRPAHGHVEPFGAGGLLRH